MSTLRALRVPVGARREFLSTIFGPESLLLVTTSFATSSVKAYEGNTSDYEYNEISFSSVEEIARYIKQHCNSNFLQSVKASEYNFLYRGLSAEGEVILTHSKQRNDKNLSAVLIKNEPYDLLDLATYQSADAASYFQSLEDKLSSAGSSIKPSNSHLGTTCPKEAAKWGMAVSIWPLGENGVEFAWLENGGIFWPAKINELNGRSLINAGLDMALQGDAGEIMFRADHGFIAVPAQLDSALKSCLKNF